MDSSLQRARRAWPAAALTLLAAAAASQTWAAEPLTVAAANSLGTLNGTVTDKDGKPIAGAKVQLSNAGGKVVAQSQTDSQGQYSINGITPGSYSVSASKSGGYISAAVEIAAGGTSQSKLQLGAAAKLQTVTVVGQRFERARNQLSPSTGSSQYTFNEKAIERLPQGDHTPFNQVLLQAPGVANDSFGQVHIRGDHNDLQYRLNGIILPDGVSGFGQVFDPRFAKSITLNTGALPAEYGLRTAGVVDIVTKERIDQGDIDLYGGSHDTVNPSFQLGKTYGPFSAYVTGQYLSSNLGVENPTSSSNAIHDWTSQGKGFGYFSYLLGSHTKLSAILAATGTRLEIPDNPGQAPNSAYLGQLGTAGFASIPDSSGLNERQYERNQYGILALQGLGANDMTYQVAVFDRVSSVEFAPDFLGDLAFNGDASRLKRKASALGLQGDLSYPLSDTHTLSVGFSGSSEDDRSDNTSSVFTTSGLANNGNCATGTPDDSGTYCVTGGPVGITDNNPKNGNTLLSLYAQDKWDVSNNLIVNYGLRFDKLNAFASGSQLSPRIGMIDYLTPRTTIHAGYARYFTPPPTELVPNETLSRFNNTTQQAVITQNDPVLPERAHYFDAGVVHQLTPALNVGLDSYYRFARNLIDEGQFGSALIFSPFNYREGHIYGVEFTSAYHQGGLSAYLNLARSVAQGTDVISGQFQFSDPAELAYIRSHYVYLDHHQRWTASGGASYQWLGTNFGMDGTYGSGLRQDFANLGKLPTSVQIDLSASRDVHISESFGNMNVRLAALNVLDRSNEIRSGTGIGVGAPQFGPRASLYFGVTKPFGI
ncbi:MAG: TonB-dependent receptor [Nevskia sp.]|nr:TonB-dependent receptor [Nevskia sp.]